MTIIVTCYRVVQLGRAIVRAEFMRLVVLSPYLMSISDDDDDDDDDDDVFAIVLCLDDR